ncbi:MAG: hypothetical protein IPP76_01430 [Moraxellaceae bacterium]|nr:hypothetical protein [Moraxellaceae bacterium]
MYSNGIITSRDSWVYNYSERNLIQKMKGMVDFYNQEVTRFEHDYIKGQHQNLEDFLNRDSSKISWGVNLKNNLAKFKLQRFNQKAVCQSLYRPFTKQWLYADKNFNHSLYSMPNIFPSSLAENIVICVTGRGETVGFSTLISNKLPNYHLIATGQCFPLYLYEANTTPTQTNPQGGLFDEPNAPTTTGYTRRDAITDAGLKHFTDFYQDQSISKEDLFYYIYGLLHSIEYKTKYADNLTKELPRIPRVKKLADFWAFSQAGRKLAELHINYETVKPYPLSFEVALDTLSNTDFYVKQMKFAKKGDKSTVIYNSKITIKNIPVAAFDYVVNGKPALEWVMERQAVTTHKDSGIVNDANDWAIETMNNPRYPLELFLRVITVSLETMEIVNGLPKLEIE